MSERQFWTEVRRGLLLVQRGISNPLARSGLGVVIAAIERRFSLQQVERSACGRRFRRVTPSALLSRIREGQFRV